jgi:hypothetical protein
MYFTVRWRTQRMSAQRSSRVLQFSSLGCSFGLDQLLCTRPGQVVVGGGSPRLGRPATLLQVITLFPARRDLLQDCQVRFRIAVLQKFLHADRKLVGSAAGHPAAPRKPDDHGRDGAYSHSYVPHAYLN